MKRFSAAITHLLGNPSDWASVDGPAAEGIVTSPLTGDTVATYPVATPADVERAIARARQHQQLWAGVEARDRARIISRVEKAVWQNDTFLLDLIQGENGKARSHAFEEIADVAMTAAYYGKVAPSFLKPRKVSGAIPFLSHTRVRHQPLGVVGIISPWNYPLTLAISDALAALCAGNAVVLKPDSNTVLTAFAAKALLVEAGLPEDLFHVVPGPGSQLGTPLIDNCDYLMFTGSTATGRMIGEQAGRNLIGYSAELGGKNPLIVLNDAPLARAVKGAVKAVTSNSGQLCISIERIYIEDGIWDRFVPAFVKAIKKVKVGADYRWSTGMGPLISARQLETVEAHVDDARKKGATVLTGGEALPNVAPWAYAPTVLTDVTDEMVVFREETFGPVVSLYRVHDADDAVDRANDSEYGLNASIWTTPSRGRQLAPAIKAGTVNINDGYIAAWASMGAPMGGMKASGVGRRHGAEGLLKYTDAQTVATSRFLPIQAPGGVSEKMWARIMKNFISYGK